MNISSWRLDLDYADLDLEGKSGGMDLDEIDNSKDGDGDEVDDNEDEGDGGDSSEMNDDDTRKSISGIFLTIFFFTDPPYYSLLSPPLLKRDGNFRAKKLTSSSILYIDTFRDV